MFSDQKLIDEIGHFSKHDRERTIIYPAQTRKFSMLAFDTSLPGIQRELSLWAMTYLGERHAVGTLTEIASNDQSNRMRKSASWALMKLGALQALLESISSESDTNVGTWKTHLVLELQDRANEHDTRPVRVLENNPFDFTMPLEVEGVVEFRDGSGEWHSYVTGPMSNERLIGNLTPAINANTFDTMLVLQKRIPNINGTGKDHVEGYFLKGISRQISENVYRHQYEAISKHTVYKSGKVGDESQGIIENATASLMRVADTHLTIRDNVAFPYPHSVRGAFKGFVYMNPEVLASPSEKIDGLLQIISPVDPNAGHLVNGVFQGTFRGVPEDIDDDGVVELNGVEMHVSSAGTVLNRTPASK